MSVAQDIFLLSNSLIKLFEISNCYEHEQERSKKIDVILDMLHDAMDNSIHYWIDREDGKKDENYHEGIMKALEDIDEQRIKAMKTGRAIYVGCLEKTCKECGKRSFYTPWNGELVA